MTGRCEAGVGRVRDSLTTAGRSREDGPGRMMCAEPIRSAGPNHERSAPSGPRTGCPARPGDPTRRRAGEDLTNRPVACPTTCHPIPDSPATGDPVPCRYRRHQPDVRANPRHRRTAHHPGHTMDGHTMDGAVPPARAAPGAR